MKPVSIQNNVGQTMDNYALKIIVEYDSDMDQNYHDIRFKHEDYPTQWLPYWIENYDTVSAIVWVKVPSLPIGQSNMYIFYGNPNAQDQSNFYDVFSEWAEEWANDEKISVHVYTEGAWDPDVCYGGGKFLVVWEEGEAENLPYTLFYKQDIRGSLYDVDGTPVNLDFTIRSGQDPQWRHEDPSVAYGGGKFFVVWSHYYTSTDPQTMNLKGRFVSSSGTVSGSDIIICEEDDAQLVPMVKFDNINNRFCVVWEDHRQGTGNFNIYAKLYDTDGNQIGGEKVICDQANNQGDPWIAFDSINQQYMIVYKERTGDFTTDVWGQLFTKDLIPIGNRFRIVQGTSSERYLFPCVEFSIEAERYLVTYNGGTPAKPNRGNVYAKAYDTSGNLKASAQVKSGYFQRTDIAPYLGTAFLVCFNGGGKIWGRFILVDGSITVFDDDIQLSSSASAEADWVNVASDENEIFIVWEDARIDYIPPWDGMPDTYGNIWHLNIGDSSDVTLQYGDEKNIILEAQITSKNIVPENLFRWYDFDATFLGNLRFDILDGEGNPIAGYQDMSPGMDLSNLNNDMIRLRAVLSRDDPSNSPSLDQWMVRYIGEDDEAPRTSVDHIDGVKGQNEWYIEESVTIWLKTIDFPEQTGSGVETTYYTLNSGASQVYNDEAGIFLSASQDANWMGDWTVVFWSVDVAGNIESHDGPENRVRIKIDAERPFIEISEPINEQQLNTPFTVRAKASDNAEIDRVEFDIEPFGERDGAPYSPDGYNPPDEYWWECDVGPKVKSLIFDPQTTGTNVMLRAQVYDKSGQTWIHEIWIYVENWGRKSLPFKPPHIFIESLKLGFSAHETLDISFEPDEQVDNVEFTAIQQSTVNQLTIIDSDNIDGYSARFNVPTGFYTVKATCFRDEKQLSSEIIARVLYISV
jgi:hypothetical protein